MINQVTRSHNTSLYGDTRTAGRNYHLLKIGYQDRKWTIKDHPKNHTWHNGDKGPSQKTWDQWRRLSITLQWICFPQINKKTDPYLTEQWNMDMDIKGKYERRHISSVPNSKEWKIFYFETFVLLSNSQYFEI